MKKLTIAIGLIVSLVLIMIIFLFLFFQARQNGYFWRGEFMSLRKVCKRWGNQAFNLETFKAAGEDESVRARMACSLIKNQKKYVGIHRGEIRNLFGEPDGYYLSDMISAYIIESALDWDQDTWQLVFLINRKGGISRIAVHKNCCDWKTRKARKKYWEEENRN